MTVLSTLLATAGLDLAAQWLGWAYGAYHRTEKYYDLTGSATYVGLVAWHCLRRRGHQPRRRGSLLVGEWGGMVKGCIVHADRCRWWGGGGSRWEAG